mgnify:FL=1
MCLYGVSAFTLIEETAKLAAERSKAENMSEGDPLPAPEQIRASAEQRVRIEKNLLAE